MIYLSIHGSTYSSICLSISPLHFSPFHFDRFYSDLFIVFRCIPFYSIFCYSTLFYFMLFHSILFYSILSIHHCMYSIILTWESKIFTNYGRSCKYLHNHTYIYSRFYLAKKYVMRVCLYVYMYMYIYIYIYIYVYM